MTIPFDEMQTRRLPVYLLLDCSGSMQGTKIVQVNNGVQLLYQELMADPRSANTVHISLIPFAATAYQLELVPIAQFTPPQLTVGGGTSLGAALGLLNQSLDADLKPNVMGQKGDYKPLIFLLTDGQPTDSWQGEAQKLQSRTTNRAQNIVALAIGHDADEGVLKQITSHVLRMDAVTPDALRGFFQWMSASIKTASQAAQAGDVQGVQMPPVPNGITFDL
jgi:uncharacterized protein YegL